MNTSRSPLYGGVHLQSDRWTVIYDAITGGASVLPQDHAQPWSKAAVGSPVESANNGMLSLATSLASDGCLYSFSDANFDTWEGAYLDALVFVESSPGAADGGAFLGLELGDAAAAAYLRTDGVNLQGAASFSVDLTGWRWVRLGLQGAEARLWVDNVLVQSYGFSYLTESRRAVFGVVADRGPAELVWRYVRARRFWGGEAFGSDALVTIGPYYQVFTDLPASADGTSFQVWTQDHSSIQAFTLAEPPRITMDDGSDPADSGILVELIAPTDGGTFACKVANLTYGTDLGYGSGLPDFVLKWSRAGLVEP
jgi:hypothetical protein